MRFRNLLFLLALCWGSAHAQTRDWSTIRETDTPYFAGGIFDARADRYGAPGRAIGRLIRRIVADSIRQSGSEKRIFFPLVFRGIDTPGIYGAFARMSPGWQGPFCRQVADSIDEFYNFRSDTIRIRLKALQGTSWALMRDSIGLEIRATLSAMGAITLNGITDSFREATLQAYRNNATATHPYNGRKLRWSKKQGWIKTLDWYIFPYAKTRSITYPPPAGAKEDSATYDRLDDTLDLSTGQTMTDLQTRYQPGNAWRLYEESGNAGVRDYYHYDHDSVLSVVFSGNKCVVQLRRSSCEFRLLPPTGPQSPSPYWQATPQTGIVLTDTLTAVPVRIPKIKWIVPDDTLTPGAGVPTAHTYLLMDTLCRQSRVVRELDFTLRADSGALYFLHYNPPEYDLSLAGFGMLAHREIGLSFDGSLHYNYSRLEYLKTASCTYGNYINVAALSVGATTLPAPEISLIPNPADKVLFINTPEALAGSAFCITDLQGKTLKSGRLENGQTAVPVAEIAAGLYLLRVSGKGVKQVQKLVIQR